MPPIPRLDLLFVIDNGEDYEKFRQSVHDNLTTAAKWVVHSGLDTRVAVTTVAPTATTPRGQFVYLGGYRPSSESGSDFDPAFIASVETPGIFASSTGQDQSKSTGANPLPRRPG